MKTGPYHPKPVCFPVRLLRLGEQGHRGVSAAVDTLESLYVDAVVQGGNRDAAEAEYDWQRALDGAPNQITSRTPSERRGCCPVLVALSELAKRFGKVVAPS